MSLILLSASVKSLLLSESTLVEVECKKKREIKDFLKVFERKTMSLLKERNPEVRQKRERDTLE